MQTCDLHVHSNYSDGSFTPEAIVDSAISLGISAVALCDHNTVAGVPRFLEYAKGKNVHAVSGIEFSTVFEGTELHILGLFIDPSFFGQIEERVDEYDRLKEESNVRLIENLNTKGYSLDYCRIKSSTPKGHINRVHIAQALLEKGYVLSVDHAFNTLLSPMGEFYTPPKRPSAEDTVSFIKSIGGVAVLAHPFLKLDENKLYRFLRLAVPLGLDGMETIYPLFDLKTTEKAHAIAREFGILPSGGSDFHGKGKPDIMLGTGKNNISVPFEYYIRLKEKSHC